MNTKKLPEIESIILVTQQGAGSKYTVGENNITNIIIDYRQIANDTIINVIVVKKGDTIISEISMLTPYVIKFKDNK